MAKKLDNVVYTPEGKRIVMSQPAGKRTRGLDMLKSKYGRMFCLHWEIGLLIFIILPFFKSIAYSFSEVTINPGSVDLKWIGFENYNFALNKDPYFTNTLTATLGTMAYSLPVIVILSLILALLLNQKFRGRIFFRSLYFLPVIIATGVVVKLLFQTTSNEVSTSGVSESFAAEAISAQAIIDWMKLPNSVGVFLGGIINNIFNLVWDCGIQVVLFISGMQSIADSYYEVSKVEGATKWEEFWFITLPLLARTTLLVIVYTMVELITDETNAVMDRAYTFMMSQQYAKSSAMLWIYFAIVGAAMGAIVLFYSVVCLKRWDTGR